MKSISAIYLVIFFCLSVFSSCKGGEDSLSTDTPKVLTGLDILVRNGFAELGGKRVGVITNHTGVDNRGRSIIQLIDQTSDIKLAAVFSPEHGLKGIIDDKYEEQNSPLDSLPVYSLYGKTRKPLPEWLKGIDVLVFDIQDIGTRFYTYISTMALAMQAAAENDIEFMVLDRPNVIGGLKVEGPVLEENLCGNFIAYYPIALRHGMTVAELARLFNAEYGIGCKLEVIKMEGWHRGMYWNDTGLTWINPSPNMRSLAAAILYPGLGISEATNLSVGRGTDIPFEIYGAPYIDSKQLTSQLNSLGLAGITFRDTTFTPVSNKFKNENCHGVRAIVTDRDRLDSVAAGLHLLAALKVLYPDTYDISGIDRWVGRKDVKQRIAAGQSVEGIVESWQDDLDNFKTTRERYLLY